MLWLDIRLPMWLRIMVFQILLYLKIKLANQLHRIDYHVCSLNAAAAAGGVYGSIAYVGKLPLKILQGRRSQTVYYESWSGSTYSHTVIHRLSQ